MLRVAYGFLIALFILPAQIHGQGGNHAVLFDGKEGYVDCGNNEALNPASAITLEAWVFSDTFNTGRIISKWGSDSGYEIDVSTGKIDKDKQGQVIRFGHNQRSPFSYPAAGLEGSWVHIAGTWDGSQHKLYVNGALVRSRYGWGAMAPSPNNLLIGRMANLASNSTFDGVIEEVRVWDVARPENEVRESMHRTLKGDETGLVGYWRFDEDAGPTTADHSGNSEGATLKQGASRTVSTAPIGPGSSHSATVDTTGTVDFVDADLSVKFTEKSDANDFVATVVSGELGGAAPAVSTLLGSKYRVVNTFGTGTFVGDLTFKFSAGTVSQAPGELKLFSRSSFSEGDWTELGTAAQATDSTVTFQGINTSGQFVIGSDSPIDPVVNARY